MKIWMGGRARYPRRFLNYHSSRTHTHRRLNLILFLNPEWERSWGGCLELLRDPFESHADSRKDFLPVANSAVIFETTEASWHGFQRIRIPEGKSASRKSIAVYFYSKDRPAADTAASHATFYYSRPLPEHLQPGYTLREQDVGELRNLLVRRDRQLQFLYQRELEFSESLENSAKAIAGLNETVASVLGSASFKLGRALTWPIRRLKVPHMKRALLIGGDHDPLAAQTSIRMRFVTVNGTAPALSRLGRRG